jgi:hypothetical protein
LITRQPPAFDRQRMTDPGRPRPDQPDTASEVDPDVAQLLGLRPADADAMPTSDELDGRGEITDTRIYQGDLEARPPDSDQPDDASRNLESLAAADLRDGETDDPMEAAEEGLTWIPPTDPPLRIDADGPEVAAGFGTSATDEPFDQDHHGEALPAVDEVEARVLEALRADAATAGIADDLVIDAEGARVILAGSVDDVEDEDAVVAVAEAVSGVREAVSRLEVRGLGAAEPRRSTANEQGEMS